MKAWVVKSNCEDFSEVIFNNHGLAARRIGAESMGLDFDECTTRRAKEFDSYADDGYVPKNVLIEEFGWWFECSHCGAYVTEDVEFYHEKNDSIYCNRKCRANELLEKRKINKSHLDFHKELNSRFPELDFKNLSKYPYISMSAEADIPSCVAPIKFRMDDKDDGVISAWSQARDVDAFTQWKDSRNKLKLKDK